MKSSISTNDNLSDDEKEQINTLVDEKTKWMDNNMTASKEEYDDVLKEVQDIVNPIMEKMYGGDATKNAEMPSTGEPNIEEVD